MKECNEFDFYNCGSKKTNKVYKTRTAKGYNMELIKNLKSNESFLITASIKEVQRYSILYGVKVKTETSILINPKSLKAEKVLKVTII